MFYIEGIIAGEVEDLKVINKYYFTKFTKRSKLQENQLMFKTSIIPRESINRLCNTDIQRKILRGIIGIITGQYVYFGFKEISIKNTSNKVVARGFEQHICPSYSPLFNMIHVEVDATQIYVEAFKDCNLMNVLLLFSNTLPNYDRDSAQFFSLYSIYEIIMKFREFKVDKAGEKKSETFCFLANNSRNPLHGMRHGTRISKEPDNKRTVILHDWRSIIWAMEYIRDLIIDWLKKDFKIEIIKSVVDLDKIVKLPLGGKIEFISPSEEFEREYLR